MTNLQIKALEEGMNLLKEISIPFPVPRGRNEEEYHDDKSTALAERTKTVQKFAKAMEWVSTALEDGKEVQQGQKAELYLVDNTKCGTRPKG